MKSPNSTCPEIKRREGRKPAKRHMQLFDSPLVVLVMFGRAGTPHGLGPLPIVAILDTQRYLGWRYETARFQRSFEKSPIGVTAEYCLRKRE
jgi:lipocalin